MPMSPHRPALAAILVATVAAFLLVARPAVAAPGPASPSAAIVQTALKYNGTYQGECWTFVKRVVAEATGGQMGFDYRQGFFDAGAIEVSIGDAAPGDVIQIANDQNTSPDADYPGLHTGIVLAVNGDGTFQVIDSNRDFDGIVHTRDDYSPLASAGRFPGLTFHIYRFSGTASSTPAGRAPRSTTATQFKLVPVDPASVAPGDKLYTNTPGDVLRLRSAPNGMIITILADRTPVTVVSLEGFANGYHWADVKTPAGEGFVAIEFLAKNAAPAVTSSSTGSASAPAATSGSNNVNPVRPFRSFALGLTSNE